MAFRSDEELIAYIKSLEEHQHHHETDGIETYIAKYTIVSRRSVYMSVFLKTAAPNWFLNWMNFRRERVKTMASKRRMGIL
jgi:hypothetical protein